MKAFLDSTIIYLVVIKLCSLVLRQIVGTVHHVVCSTLAWFVFALKIIRDVILNSYNR